MFLSPKVQFFSPSDVFDPENRPKYHPCKEYGCFPKIGVKNPKWMVKIMESPINPWMIWGEKPPIFGNTHMVIYHNSTIIFFFSVFHYKPSILGYPYFWKHPYHPCKIYLTHILDFSTPDRWFSPARPATSLAASKPYSFPGAFQRMVTLALAS